jgi:glycosyltransferase involved in cell wall biosynthesis
MANAAVSTVGGVMAALLVRRRWQVAIGAGLHPEGVVAGVAARLLRRPFLAETWLVGPYGNVDRLAGSTLRRPVVRLLSSARAVLTATSDGADELAEIGIPSERIRIESPSVDTSRFVPPTAGRRELGRRALRASAPNVLVYAGRFDLRQKRLDLLIGAWHLVQPRGWELVLVGEGGGHDAVRGLAAGGPGVHLRPWADDVALALAGADAFALPTRFESPGYALFEGMAAGLPGLASSIGL